MTDPEIDAHATVLRMRTLVAEAVALGQKLQRRGYEVCWSGNGGHSSIWINGDGVIVSVQKTVKL